MKTRIFASLIFLACVVFLTACPQQTSINQVNGDPARYRGKEILIVGTVTNSFGAVGQGAYELSDETGKIWVLTQRGAPTKGARVGAVAPSVQPDTLSIWIIGSGPADGSGANPVIVRDSVAAHATVGPVGSLPPKVDVRLVLPAQ